MKKLPWLIEPVTGDRYVRDEVPYYKLESLDRYRHIGDYTPPAVWGKFVLTDPRWDKHMLGIFGSEYSRQARETPDDPVPISAQINQLGKSYARTNGSRRVLGMSGVIMWAWFPRIDPCWLIIDNKDTYKLLSQEELGLQHG